MNKYIENVLNKIDSNYNKPKILTHQLATIDFLYKRLIYDNKSVLLFHKMGSGKTIISLILSFLLARKNYNVIIILPNINIKNMWENLIPHIKHLIPSDNYKINNIKFITKKIFLDTLPDNFNEKKIINIFKKTIFIIDEAHNLFGNIGSESIIKLNNIFIKNNVDPPLYVLVTGSPITNTPQTLKYLINILTNKNIKDDEYMTQTGKRIFNFVVTSAGKNLIENILTNQISYYNQAKNDIPKSNYIGKPLINIPVILCKMSDQQTENYNKIKVDVTNEMFLKFMLDMSFTDMGDINNISNFETYIKDKEYHKFTKTLSLNKGIFVGEELKTLNNSCKIKYFMETKFNQFSKNIFKKSFIYFSNSKIGGRFLKDVLKAKGIQEYTHNNNKPILPNFVCFYCLYERSCKVCKPITYIMITSIYCTNINQTLNDEEKYNSNNQINYLLEIFNSPNNLNGEEIMFVFGSKIISEAYTLKEVKEIWFLTIPDSLSEQKQTIARCLRNFSYIDISTPVDIYILIAITNDVNYEFYLKLKKDLKTTSEMKDKELIEIYIYDLINSDNKMFSYDFKKMLYLEIKSEHTNEIHDLFKKLSIKIEEPVDDDIIQLFVMEILRRLSYYNQKYTINDVINKIPNKITSVNIEKIINKFIDDGMIIYNKIYNQSILKKENNNILVKPILLKYKSFVYKINL